MNSGILTSRTRAKLKLLYPDVQVRVIRFLNTFYTHHRRILNVTQGLRTFKKQDWLYAQGRTRPGDVVTRARGGYSYHNYGLAVDLAFAGLDPYLDRETEELRDYLWDEIGRHGEMAGFLWGGNFAGISDRPHLQIGYGRTIRQWRSVYKIGGLRGVWGAIDKIRQVPIGSDWTGPLARARNIEQRPGVK